MTACRWCAEPISQPETGRPREFCDDSERVAYNRRKVTARPGWDAPTDFHEPMNRATWEAERRFYAAHPERQAPPWHAALQTNSAEPTGPTGMERTSTRR